MNIRYILVNRSAQDPEIRVLSLPGQGRNTYATREDAQRALEIFKGPGGLVRVLGDRINTLEVLAVECWPHHDPKKKVFGDDYVEPTREE